MRERINKKKNQVKAFLLLSFFFVFFLNCSLFFTFCLHKPSTDDKQEKIIWSHLSRLPFSHFAPNKARSIIQVDFPNASFRFERRASEL